MTTQLQTNPSTPSCTPPPPTLEMPRQCLLQFIVRLDHCQTHVIECLLDFAHHGPANHNVKKYIVEQLAIKAKLPERMLHLHNANQIEETLNELKTCVNILSTQSIFLSAFTHLPILGGKGGFGTLLKGQSKQAGARQTTDFGACRDLNGRRLRHINDEIKLQKWRESMQRRAARLGNDKHSLNAIQEELQALKTSSGIRNWHLMVPHWGAGEMSQKHRRREEIRLEREIQKWAQEENEKTIQKMQKKRELEQLKMDYAMAGSTQYKGQVDVDQVLSHSILEGMKKRKLRDNATSEVRGDTRQEEINDVVEEKEFETTIELGLTSEFICTLSGDIVVVEQDSNAPNNISSQILETKVEQSEITIQSKSEFATAVVLLPRKDCDSLNSIVSKEQDCQSLYYEVTIETGGIAQVGWAYITTNNGGGNQGNVFSPNSDCGDGVGDDSFSYGFDGLRGKIFHNGNETNYGPPMATTPWKKGDVVGCLYDRSNRTISFSVNGNDYGKAFDIDEQFTDQWLCPAISMNEGEVLIVNIGPIFHHGPKVHFLAVSSLFSSNVSKTNNVKSTLKDTVENSKGAHHDETLKSYEYVDLSGIPLPSKQDMTTNLDSDIGRMKKSRVDTLSSRDINVNLDDYNSPEELESLGMEKLKEELFKLGCKCGGSLEERAKRLFSLKGLQRNQIPQKLRGKNFDQVFEFN